MRCNVAVVIVVLILWCILQSDEATELNKKLMEKCETAAQESEMLAHIREQV